MLEKLGFDSQEEKGFLSSPKHPDWLWGSPNLCSMGTETLFPGVWQLARATDDSTPFGAEVKNEWRYTSTPRCKSYQSVQEQLLP